MLTPSDNKHLVELGPPPLVQDNQMLNNPGPLPPYTNFNGGDAAIGEAYQKALFARCASGNHQVERKYGIVGILTAAVCFPVGLICLFVDSHKRCSRCGIVV